MTISAPTPNLRILLAEDNSANRLVASALLQQEGHTVFTAEDGASALDSLERNIFDLVLLDVMMPVLDGLRTLRRIRRHYPDRTAMPIFALTAHTGTQDQQRYRLAGFDAVVSKPLYQGDIEMAWKLHHAPRRLPDMIIEKNIEVKANPMLDYAMIDQIKAATNTERRAAILASYWASTEALCLALKNTLPAAMRGETRALTEFRRSVHTLKGASLSVGASRIAELCRILRNAPPADIPNLLNDLIRALLESRSTLSAAYSDDGLTLRTG